MNKTKKFVKLFSLLVFSAIIAPKANPLYAEETQITTTTTTTTTVKTIKNGSEETSETTTVIEKEEPERKVTEKRSNNDSYRSQMIIGRMLRDNNGLEKNKGEISELSRDLSLEQKYLILDQHKKDAGLPFVVNLIVGMGIGSFIQGDAKGGWTGLLGELGSIGVLVGGQFLSYGSYYDYNGDTYLASTIMMIGGIISYTVFRIYELIRPWSFAKSYNQHLSETLRLALRIQPYISVAQTQGATYGAAITARF